MVIFLIAYAIYAVTVKHYNADKVVRCRTHSKPIHEKHMENIANLGKSMGLIGLSRYYFFTLLVVICIVPTGVTCIANYYIGNGDGIAEIILSFLVSLPIATVLYFFTQRLEISIQSHSLYIKTGLCTEIIPLLQLRIDQIDAIRIKEKKQWQPKLRENGISLANYNSGWFLLNNGMSALFVGGGDFFLTIPTKMNFVIMIGAKSPSILIDAIVRDLES